MPTPSTTIQPYHLVETFHFSLFWPLLAVVLVVVLTLYRRRLRRGPWSS